MESKFIACLVDFNISITFYPSDAYNFLSELAPKGKVTSTNIWFIISFPKEHNEDWLGGGGGLCGPSGEKILTWRRQRENREEMWNSN